MIFNMSGGGPSAALNFKVLGGTTKPTNPTENTIWVNTDQEITAWAFAKEEPTAPVKGMVCIKTNDTAGIEINLVKKNIATIHIVSAKQYVSGAWVDKEVTVWQDGEWRTSCLWVFDYDKLGYTWTAVGKKPYDGSGMGNSAPTQITNADGSMTFRQNSINISCGIAYIDTVFDLSDFKTLEYDGVNVSTYANMDNNVGLYVWSNIGSYIGDNVATRLAGNSNGVRTADISDLDGNYYIGVSVVNHESYVTVRRIRLLV